MEVKRRDEIVSQISDIVKELSNDEKRKVFDVILESSKEGLPISAFKSKLSSFGIIVKYLKEEENKSFKEIAKMLNRKLSTIYNTYNKSKSFFSHKLDTSDVSIRIPFDIFHKRKHSVLETIAAYLVDEKKLSLNQAAELLHKNYNTVKTVYRRYKLKK